MMSPEERQEAARAVMVSGAVNRARRRIREHLDEQGTRYLAADVEQIAGLIQSAEICINWGGEVVEDYDACTCDHHGDHVACDKDCHCAPWSQS
jgi:hypothetical protein